MAGEHGSAQLALLYTPFNRIWDLGFKAIPTTEHRIQPALMSQTNIDFETVDAIVEDTQ